jgi:hypothetical protein
MTHGSLSPNCRLAATDVAKGFCAALLGSSALAACSTHNTVVHVRLGSLPTTEVKGPVCAVTESEPTPTRRHGLVTVDKDPNGVTAVWLPGLNQRPCRAQRTSDPASTARRLAHDIRSAPKFPSGDIACPADDGSAVGLYFSVNGDEQPEYVRVALRGCAPVDAPGRSARRSTDALRTDLGNIAPTPWASALRGTH